MLPSSTSVVMKELGIDATCISIILSQSIKMAWKHVSLSNQSSLTLSGWGSYIYIYVGAKKKELNTWSIFQNFHPTLSMYIF